MNGLTAVSLFAGIGGFDKALQRAGANVVAAVEIDQACRGVLARHFPETALFNDVTEVTGDQLRAAGFVPERGIITAGFPCQDLSIAGRRTGLGGARSGLFWHVVRLARELSPQWLLLENVPGLLSAVCSCPGDDACVDNGRSVRCGEWRAEPIPGPADDLPGDDCFVCSHPWDVHDAGGFCSPCGDTCAELPEVKFRKVFVPNVPHGVKGGACAGGCMPAHGGAMGTILGALGNLGYGFAYRMLDAQFFSVPQRRERVFIAGCLGDGAAPAEILLEPESGEGDPAAGGEARASAARGAANGAGGARTVGTLGTTGPGGGWRVGADEAAAGHLVASTLQASGGIRTRAEEAAGNQLVASTLQGGGRRGHRIDAEGAAGGHLVPCPVAPSMSARQGKGPDSDATNGFIAVPIALRGRAEGSQTPAVAFSENQRGELLEHDRAHQLAAGGGKPGQGYPAVREGMAVRRLSPRECERLQGFPDDWSRWLADGTEQSDSARYRQCGNAVAIPVAKWITRRIVAYEQGRMTSAA